MPIKVFFLSRDAGSLQATIPVIKQLAISEKYHPYVVCLQPEKMIQDIKGVSYLVIDNSLFEQRPKKYLSELLRTSDAQLVVSGSSPAKGETPETPEQHLIQVARANNIPTIAILDFWGMYAERFFKNKQELDITLIPDLLCVMDTIVRDDLVELGVDKNKIVITHNPWLDTIAENSFSAKDEAENVIIFVSQPLAETKEIRGWKYTQLSLVHNLIEALNKVRCNEHWLIEIWPHPAEDGACWNDIMALSNENLTLKIAKDKLKQSLAKAALVVSSHSTVAYEAAYYATPGLSLRMGGGPDLAHHITDRIGFTKLITTAEELEDYLVKTDLKKERNRLTELKNDLANKGIFFSKGGATKKVLDVIDSILMQEKGIKSKCQNQV